MNGTGLTTRDAARRAASGGALGIDLSAEMIALARRRATAEGLDNARFEQADAQICPFGPGSFDVAISRTGAMFFGDPHAAFTNIARALRNEGRLVLLSWQPLPANEWVTELTAALAAGRDVPAPAPNAPGPFAHADPGRVRQLLAGAGFTSIKIDPVQAPMWFGADPADAYEFALGLLGWMLEGLDESQRTGALGALRGLGHHSQHPRRRRLQIRCLADPRSAGLDRAVPSNEPIHHHRGLPRRSPLMLIRVVT